MRHLLLSALGVLALSACHTVHVGDQDGGSSTGDGGGPVQCGRTVCDPGLVCCNESCGICTGPGEACPAIACADDCAINADCAASEYCAYASGTCPPVCALPEGCPAPPRDGICQPRPDACPPTIREVCGCDGRTYTSACDASAAGVNVAHDGSCAPSPTCAPQDARGDGFCSAILGVVWDGERCVMIQGCECVGADCEARYGFGEEARCYAEHASCIPCAAQDATFIGSCEPAPLYAWDGAACVARTGCSCEGADCDALFADPTSCERAHAHCTPGGSCVSDADCGGGWCRFAFGECGGSGDGLGTCEPIPPPGWACDTDGPPVCGCDGVTYMCEAHAHAFATSVLHAGACSTSGPCDAMDAAGEGACLAILGVIWNGSRCEAISGCSCVGADCGRLYADGPSCEAATTGCGRAPGGTCGGFAGETCRPDEYCDFAEPHTCGGADESGSCVPRPTACADILMPACGCDGLEYGNPCEAHRAGTDNLGAPGPSGCGTW